MTQPVHTNQRRLVPIQRGFADMGVGSRSAGYARIKEGLITTPVKVGKASTLPSDEIAALTNATIAGASNDELRTLVDTLHAKRKAGGAE